VGGARIAGEGAGGEGAGGAGAGTGTSGVRGGMFDASEPKPGGKLGTRKPD
jgi:hypothetical protein